MAIVDSFKLDCETPNNAEKVFLRVQSQANAAFGQPEHSDTTAGVFLHPDNRQRLEAFLREVEHANTDKTDTVPSRDEFAALMTFKVLQGSELAHDITPGMVLDISHQVSPEFDDPNGPLAFERLDVAGDYYDEHAGLQGDPPALARLGAQLDTLLAYATQHANAGAIYSANAELCRQVWATSLAVLADVDRIKMH